MDTRPLLFDEGSILLDDSKAYFSQKILFLQQAMAPIGSETNVLVNHLKGASIYTPSGISVGYYFPTQGHYAPCPREGILPESIPISE